MKITAITIATAVLALAGCDSELVRLEPAHAPHADDAGLHVVLEQFRKDDKSADVWVTMTNQSSQPITMKAASGQASWAQATSGDQQAAVKVMRWSNHNDYDDFGGASERDINGSYTLAPGATREVEFYCTVPHAVPTIHEPWSLSIAVTGHGVITLPVVDQPVAALERSSTP